MTETTTHPALVAVVELGGELAHADRAEQAVIIEVLEAKVARDH